MKLETRRAALRAAHALTGVGIISACAAPRAPAPAPTPPPSLASQCLAITDKAFGNDDSYPSSPTQPVDPAVVRCCDQAIAGATPPVDLSSTFDRHRWACCAVKTVEPKMASVCIPWGPPVPPKMRRVA